MKPVQKVRRHRRGKINVHEARELFGRLAFGRRLKASDHDETFVVNDAWNWFRLGIVIARDNQIRLGDVERIRKTAAAKRPDSQNDLGDGRRDGGPDPH